MEWYCLIVRSETALFGGVYFVGDELPDGTPLKGSSSAVVNKLDKHYPTGAAHLVSKSREIFTGISVREVIDLAIAKYGDAGGHGLVFGGHGLVFVPSSDTPKYDPPGKWVGYHLVEDVGVGIAGPPGPPGVTGPVPITEESACRNHSRAIQDIRKATRLIQEAAPGFADEKVCSLVLIELDNAIEQIEAARKAVWEKLDKVT